MVYLSGWWWFLSRQKGVPKGRWIESRALCNPVSFSKTYSPGVHIRKSKGASLFSDGGSYVHFGCLDWRDPNQAPKLN